MERPAARRNVWRIVAAAGILLAGLTWVTAIFAFSLTDQNIAGRDYIQYWAAGRQVDRGLNPYDEAAVLKLEQSLAPGRNQAEFSLSPPLVLLLAAPLGLFSAKAGLVFFFALLFASLSISLWLLWNLHGRPDTLLYLFGFAFAPVLSCLQGGQLGILFLLCIMLFLYLRPSHPWLAGAFLAPLLLKPHLFLPFGAALLVWGISRGAYRIAGGFAVALAASLGGVYWLAPHAWPQYLQMMRAENVIVYFVPTLSNALQRLISVSSTSLRFVPDAAACLWAVWYFRTRKDQWNWMDQGMVLLLVSFLCAPYAFFFDESVLLPAVLTGLLHARQTGRSAWPIWCAGAAALIECVAKIPVTSIFYLWTVPAWFLWYVYATWKHQPTTAPTANLTEPAA